MKVTASNLPQQVNWQAIANKKQQDLKEAVRNETLEKIREERLLEIYQTKGNQLEMKSVSSFKRVNIEV